MGNQSESRDQSGHEISFLLIQWPAVFSAALRDFISTTYWRHWVQIEYILPCAFWLVCGWIHKMRRTTDAAGVGTRQHVREWDAVFSHESKKQLNNSWQQGKSDNILRSYQTFTKYPKGCFSRASFNKAEPLLQSLHRQSTCKKSLNVLHWANPRAVPAVYLILFVWWNKGTRQTGERGGYVTSWGGNRSLVMDPSRLKMVNIQVNLFGRCAAGMCKEVMVGHSQRTIISYLEMLSVTQLAGQEPALTETECV